MFTTNVKRSAAALAATAGLLAAAAPASHADSWGIGQVGTVKARVASDSYSWGQGWPTYRSGLKSDSNEVAVEGITTWPTYPSGLKADSNEVAVEGIKAGVSEVLYETFSLVADAGKGDDTITQSPEPAPVTMLDYMGSPVVT